MLTGKERLERAFSKQPLGFKPCICPGGMMNMITQELMSVSGYEWPAAHTDAALMAKLAYASYEQGCFDNVGVPFCMTVEAEALGAMVSLGSREVEPHVTGYALDSVLDWERLRVAPVTEGRMAVAVEAIRMLREMDPEIPVVGNVVGPVSVASSVVEALSFYKSLRKHPDAAHCVLKVVAQQVADFAVAQAQAGADVITISDPSGTGEILGPKLFEEYTVRYLNVVLDALKPTDVRTIVHICGQTHSVYPQLAKVKSDGLSFDAVVSLAKAREALGSHVLVGNVSTFALERSDSQKIASLVGASVKAGADIVAPACGLGTGTPLANVRAMRDACRGYAQEGE